MSTIADHPPIDHDDPGSDYRETLAWYLEIARDPAHVLRGRRPAATASPRYVGRQARIVFLPPSTELAPALSDDLLTPELEALAQAAGVTRVAWMEERRSVPHFEAGTLEAFQEGPAWDALNERTAPLATISTHGRPGTISPIRGLAPSPIGRPDLLMGSGAMEWSARHTCP